MNRRALIINFGLIMLGAIVAGLWIYLVGGPSFLSGLRDIHPGFIVLLLGITLNWVAIRFLRWHFMLRRAGIRVPIRSSFKIYLASLAGIITPAYIGESLRCILLRRRFGSPLQITVPVLIADRLFDIAALVIVVAFTVKPNWPRQGLLLFTAIVIMVAIWLFVAKKFGLPVSGRDNLRRIGIFSAALAMSLVAWLPAALLVGIAAMSVQVQLPLLSGMRVYGTSTLLGGLTLMPAGVGVTGSLAILQLQELGLSLDEGVFIVSLARIMSTGVVLATGTVFLALAIRALKKTPGESEGHHFDEIADEYGDQFSEHVWSHLIDRKIGLLTAALPNPPSSAGVGLDLGCGTGKQCYAMNSRGYKVVGLDAAQILLKQARDAGVSVTTGDALTLPFGSATLDFVYVIGVLHHLPGISAQESACREVFRVLKPGGFFIIHETNPRNPLFRFYMSYIFPLAKSIDEGIEWWIDPQRWEGMRGMRLINLRYFTFIPDFVPQRLMWPLLRIQGWLEKSVFRPYSVHYMSVLQKAPTA